MEYTVDFTEQPAGPAARAVFSVTKKRDGQTFSVATKDYAIKVVGTVSGSARRLRAISPPTL